MPTVNSYLIYTGNGSQTKFVLTGIDGWLNSGFLEIYINGTLQQTGYSLIVESGVDKVQFTTAPASGAIITIKRNTPNTITGFKNDVVDFNDGSVLTAAALDRAVEALVHISQEIEDQTGATLGLTIDQTAWDAETKRITNLGDGLNSSDAVTMGQFTVATLFGGAVVVPQVWNIANATGVGPYTLNPAPLNTDSKMFIVENGGTIVNPSDYVIDSNSITFVTSKSGAVSIRNFGVARNLIASTAVIEDNAITTSKILNGAVTLAKIQNLDADRLIGTEGVAGVPTQIPCSQKARDVLSQNSAANMRTALGCGAVAPLNEITTAYYAKNSIVADKLAANSVTAGAIASQAVTSAKIELAGPHWDGSKVYVGGVAQGGGPSPFVNLSLAGSVEVQPTGVSGAASVWIGRDLAGAASTTVRADGVPTAATDLTTKAYVDSKPFYDWDPYIVTSTYSGSPAAYTTTAGIVTNENDAYVRVRLNAHLLPYRRLCLVDGIVGPVNGNTPSGNHWWALYNGGASTMTFQILRAYFDWTSNRVSASAVEQAPSPWYNPWEEPSVYNAFEGPGIFASPANSVTLATGVFTLSAGAYYKFYRTGGGNGAWTGTYGTGEVVGPQGSGVDQAGTATNPSYRKGMYGRIVMALIRLT